MLHFYHHPMSPYSKKVFFLLEESRQAYDLQVVALEKREHRKTSYLSMNPAGRVPSIIDGDFAVHESNAILRYLTRKFGLHDLYPQCLRDQAEVDIWWEFTTNHINKPLLDVAWHKSMAVQFGWKPDHAVLGKALTSLERDMPVLERHLIGRHFLVGHGLTLADVNLIPFVHVGLKLLGEDHFPSVRAWRDLVAGRQAWHNVVAYGG